MARKPMAMKGKITLVPDVVPFELGFELNKRESDKLQRTVQTIVQFCNKQFGFAPSRIGCQVTSGGIYRGSWLWTAGRKC